MKMRLPSASMVVSIIALVVATAGTATAASVLIKNSSQVKAGSINGSDVKNRSIGSIDIADKAVNTRHLAANVMNRFTSSGFSATEAVRKVGPREPDRRAEHRRDDVGAGARHLRAHGADDPVAARAATRAC